MPPEAKEGQGRWDKAPISAILLLSHWFGIAESQVNDKSIKSTGMPRRWWSCLVLEIWPLLLILGIVWYWCPPNMWGRRNDGWWVCCGQQVHPCVSAPAWMEDVLLLPLRSETYLQQPHPCSFSPFILREDLNSCLHQQYVKTGSLLALSISLCYLLLWCLKARQA